MFEFLRFELRQQLRSPLLWLMALLFATLGWAAAAFDTVQIGGAIGNVHRNAPSVIVTLMGFMTLLGMLFVALAVSGALLRDFEQGTAELIFASPIKRAAFVGGRIGAALLMCALLYAAILAGIFIAQFMPWIEAERLGPVRLAPYLWVYAVVALPNLLFSVGLLSLLAILSRSILWVYIGVLAFLVLYGVSAALLSDLDNVWIAVLSEPLGIRAFSRTIRYWAADQRNAQLPEIAGYLLGNRALWLGISAALIGACFAAFKPLRTGTGRGLLRRRSAAAKTAPAAPAAAPALAALRTPQASGASVAVRQWLHMMRFDTAFVLRSVPFQVMLLFALANYLPTALMSGTLFETGIHPVTSRMMAELQAAYTWVLVIVVLFYAGELMHRARSARLNEVVDATPVPDWVPLAAKFGTLIAVIAVYLGVGAVFAMAIQLFKGHTALELGVYAKMLAVTSVLFVLMGGLSLCLQALTNSKFLGYALLILVLVGQSVMGSLDFTHNLYTYASAPNAPYSDMNGYGHFLSAQLWFQGYWGLFLLALLLLSAALWVRGADGGWRSRLRLARVRLRGPLGAALAATVLAFAGVGGYLFWNTNIRNEYLSPDEQLDLQARYEREFGKYRNLPQPKILATDVQVQIYPEQQRMSAEGVYRLRNPHATPIRELHVRMIEDRALINLDVGGQTLRLHDKALGYRIYRLERPLAPGEERALRFAVDYRPNGIVNGTPQTQIVENGTFFNNTLFPAFGYESGGEIVDRNERRKRGLPEPQRMPKLEDVAARDINDLSDDADWIEFSTTVCTSPDQIALSPGYLQREFTRDGRRCFSYAMDRPMMNFYAFLSARWQVRKADYNGIPIEIYHHPAHTYNVDRMIAAVKKSLAYYQAEFTPYQHRQVRILEFPRYATFAQSFANTIPYSESIGFVADLGDKDAIDYVFYVTAHEMAHQWWGHQVIGAGVQGSAMLMESLSQYSALMVMEREYGRHQMRRFLRYELDRYLSGRSGETVDEQPLYRVENQQYIHYQKGSLAFYRLREEIGEAALNRALKRYLQDKGYQQPPYTTSAELLDYIRAEAGPQHETLIADLFERITFYDNRLEAATAKRRADGRYDVTLSLRAAKRYADGKGKERPGTMDDWVEVGVFARGASGAEADEKPLYLQRHRIRDGQTTLTVTVDQKPDDAGFDPYNKLIDIVPADNRKQISL